MSCDNWTYNTAIVELDAYSSLDEELSDYATAIETAVAPDKPLKRCQSGAIADQPKARAHRHESRSRIIADTTHICPQYVWGDEGPIND